MHPISKAVDRSDSPAKASGAAVYTSDIDRSGILSIAVRSAEVQHARISDISLPELPEGYFIVDSTSYPAMNRASIVAQDWPFFAEGEVLYYGQAVLAVAGPDAEVCGQLCSMVKIEYEQLEAVSDIEQADEFFNDFTIVKGDPEQAFSAADTVVETTSRTGMQEQAYMEPQGMLADYRDGKLTVHGSLQCPYYVKNSLKNAFGLDDDSVRVIQAETGGAFGGKEDYPSIIAAHAAAAAFKSGRPVKLILDRRADMLVTPKRHPSKIIIKTAVDENGSVTAMDVDCRLDAGAYESLSGVVLERAIFICTGAYNIPNVRVRGRTMKTNHVPSGAFRGFGGPQALFAAETAMYNTAVELGVDPAGFKRRHQYKKGDFSVTGGTFRDDIKLDEMFELIDRESGYSRKFREYADRRSGSPWKGIGISWSAHGGAFTGSGEQDIIKSVVRLETAAADPDNPEDISVRVLVSNVEMGQGASTTLRKIVAEQMKLPLKNVVYEKPDTDLVPDSGPTVASRTVMIVGKLLQKAAAELSEKLSLLQNGGGPISAECRYVHPPEFEWDEESFSGDAYPGYSWSINVVEAEVDPLSYEIKLTGSWAVYDVGTPIDIRILEGQMQGGTTQSLAWSTIEKMEMRSGRPAQASFTDYTIPTTLDFPDTKCFFIDNPYRYGPFGAKAAGELPNEGPAGAVAAAVSQAVGRTITKIPILPEELEAELNE